MKRLIYISLLICFVANSQEPIRKGYWNAHRGDSIGNNRTTEVKAYYDCVQLGLTNFNGEEIYYTGPEKWAVKLPPVQVIPTSALKFNSISQGQITSTSVKIFVELSRSDHQFVYVRFRKEGGVWKETNKAKNSIFSNDNLTPKTNYEYKVFAADSQGIEISSPTLTFTTL